MTVICMGVRSCFPHFLPYVTFVYCCVFTAADWLQGPYVYALYSDYGMSTHDIELLFVVGFGSSMLFGTVVGSFADR